MYQKSDIQVYIDALVVLTNIEKKLTEDGLMFEDECLSFYNKKFIEGRIERLRNILN